MKFRIERVSSEIPSGAVAYLKMPLSLMAMEDMNSFIEKAYGEGCVCREANGWLEVLHLESKEKQGNK